VADALDWGHTQRISRVTVERKPEAVVLHTESRYDLTPERIGLEEKADLFQNVFGYTVIIT
jgi:exopolyphosphatase/guanosine-5'-triphosphate,3'-diphosphate pyrophosphatase